MMLQQLAVYDAVHKVMVINNIVDCGKILYVLELGPLLIREVTSTYGSLEALEKSRLYPLKVFAAAYRNFH